MPPAPRVCRRSGRRSRRSVRPPLMAVPARRGEGPSISYRDSFRGEQLPAARGVVFFDVEEQSEETGAVRVELRLEAHVEVDAGVADHTLDGGGLAVAGSVDERQAHRHSFAHEASCRAGVLAGRNGGVPPPLMT